MFYVDHWHDLSLFCWWYFDHVIPAIVRERSHRWQHCRRVRGWCCCVNFPSPVPVTRCAAFFAGMPASRGRYKTGVLWNTRHNYCNIKKKIPQQLTRLHPSPRYFTETKQTEQFVNLNFGWTAHLQFCRKPLLRITVIHHHRTSACSWWILTVFGSELESTWYKSSWSALRWWLWQVMSDELDVEACAHLKDVAAHEKKNQVSFASHHSEQLLQILYAWAN